MAYPAFAGWLDRPFKAILWAILWAIPLGGRQRYTRGIAVKRRTYD